MNTEMALAQLGISVADLTPEQRRKFDADGYFIVEDVFSPAEVEEMRSEYDRLRAIEGEYGDEISPSTLGPIVGKPEVVREARIGKLSIGAKSPL